MVIMSNESNGDVIKAEPKIEDNDAGGVVEAPMMKVRIRLIQNDIFQKIFK